MALPSKLDIKNKMLSQARLLGNSERGFKELCSDLVNWHGTTTDDLETLAEGTFLSVSTLRRFSTLKETELGEPYNPSNDSVERILRYFGAEFQGDQVTISKQFQNRAKQP